MYRCGGGFLGIGEDRTDEMCLSSVKVNLLEEAESGENATLGCVSRRKLQVSKGDVQRPRGMGGSWQG